MTALQRDRLLAVLGIFAVASALGCASHDAEGGSSDLEGGSSTDAAADFAAGDVPMYFDLGDAPPDGAGGDVWCPGVDFMDRLTLAQKACPYWEEFNAPPP